MIVQFLLRPWRPAILGNLTLGLAMFFLQFGLVLFFMPASAALKEPAVWVSAIALMGIFAGPSLPSYLKAQLGNGRC